MRKYNYYHAQKYGYLDRVKARVIDERIRKKYTISNEFAILRQKDKNPEEFAEYDAFVENIKAQVKKEIEEYIENYEQSQNKD